MPQRWSTVCPAEGAEVVELFEKDAESKRWELSLLRGRLEGWSPEDCAAAFETDTEQRA
jgi:hypothetical protein